MVAQRIPDVRRPYRCGLWLGGLRSTEVDRVRHLDDAAALRLRKLDLRDHVTYAAIDFRIEAFCPRVAHHSGRRDRERNNDGALELWLCGQLRLVTLAQLAEVALQISANDRFIEIADDVRLPERDLDVRRQATRLDAIADGSDARAAGARTWSVFPRWHGLWSRHELDRLLRARAELEARH